MNALKTKLDWTG